MDIAIDYSSPFVFSVIVSVFLAFFMLFRNYRFHLNALFGVLSVFSAAWFFLFYWAQDNADSDTKLYLVVLSAVIAYFLFLLLHQQEALKTNLQRVLPQGYLLFPAWAVLLLGLEIFIVGLALLVYIFSSSDLASIPQEYAETARSVTLAFSLLFLVESGYIVVKSVARLVSHSDESPRRALETNLAWFFGLFWILFTFGGLVFTALALTNYSDGISNGLAVITSIALLGVLLVQSVVITRRYYLNFKVIITQLIAALIVIFNIASILNSSSVEEIVLRVILIIILALLSHLLVRSVISEISKRKRTQETAQAIYNANKKLRKLDRAKSDFIAGASHQLRSPLSVIKGIASMLLDGSYGKLSGSIKDAMEKVYISNERLIGLIESLLDISHLEEGKVEFNFVKIGLNDISQKAVDGLALQAQNKKLYLKFTPWRKSKLLVWADESKVTEAVSNLIDNALKYTRKGGVNVKVQQINGTARVSVSDTGIGLKKDEIGSLFQKFVRAGRGNKLSTVGTGLGLYVVRKMVEAHKGKIWAESAGEGRGSTFVIELPLNMKTPPDKKFIQRIVMEKQSA
jgi:signal transduction histidine kinase